MERTDHDKHHPAQPQAYSSGPESIMTARVFDMLVSTIIIFF